MTTITGGLKITGGLRIANLPIGAINYLEMGPPIIPGNQLEDGTATVNEPIGFTINDSGATGVGVPNLTNDNGTYFSNLGTGSFTATFGPGSTHASAEVVITSVGANHVVFYIDSGVSYPFTVNFPITIS
jgi:hypothetical protein